MWNKDYSLQLSIWAVRIFFILWIVCVLFGYFIVDAYVDHTQTKTLIEYEIVSDNFYVILIALYSCLLIAIFLLNELNKLLLNIKKRKIFISDNVICLRRISWLCIAVGFVNLIATIWYAPFMLVVVTFVFIALIVRVVKNVIEEAIVIKEENDFTI